MDKFEQKHYQLEGIPYYVTAPTKKLVVLTSLKNRWGVCEENLVEIERVPTDCEKHIFFSERGL